MLTTSSLFQRAIRQGGRRKTVVDVLLSGQVVLSNIPVSTGSITIDRNSAVRRSGTITIPDPTFGQAVVSKELLPYGYEVRIRQGIVYPDRSEELVNVGIFIVYDVSWDEATGKIPTLSLFDRSQMMQDNQCTFQLSFAGQQISSAISAINSWHYPGATVTFGAGVDTTLKGSGTMVFDRGSNLEMLQTLARGLNAEFYFNADGNAVVNPIPVLNQNTLITQAVFDINPKTGGILGGANQSYSRKDVYNWVTVYGATNEAGAIASATVYDDSPTSPVRRSGPFGIVGLRVDDSSLPTSDVCRKVALDKLNQNSRLAHTGSFSAIANPALQEGDIISLTLLDDTSQPALLESFVIPVDGVKMTGNLSLNRSA